MDLFVQAVIAIGAPFFIVVMVYGLINLGIQFSESCGNKIYKSQDEESHDRYIRHVQLIKARPYIIILSVLEILFMLVMILTLVFKVRF